MQTETRPRFYLPELDGLRFIAFLLVFIHNAPSISASKIWTLLHDYGWIGVDLFFCLSGFLITKLLITEYQHTGDINIRGFYFRRILRIWPLYYFYIPIGLLFIIFTAGWHEVIPYHLAGLITFIYNFVYLFLTHKVFVVYLHLWTISYEEQFYVAIPWLARIFVQSKRNAIYVLAIFIAGNLIRAACIYFNVKHPLIYLLPITHFEAMLGGIAIGLGMFDGLFRNVTNWLLLLAGLILNGVVFTLPNTYEIGWNLMLTYPLVGIGMTLIVFGVIKSNASLVSKLLRIPLLVYLGKISYGLYIYHLLAISVVVLVVQNARSLSSMSMQTQNWIYFLAGLLLTILFSIASYNVLEKPFLKIKEKYGRIDSRPI